VTRRLTNAQHLQIVRRYRAREKLSIIAGIYGITEGYVTMLAVRRGCTRREPRVPSPTYADPRRSRYNNYRRKT
jgi:hypothetical protein